MLEVIHYTKKYGRNLACKDISFTLPDGSVTVLLLDEPFIGLDPHAIKELKNTIEELRAAGATLLVSTHIIDSVDMLWDRTIIMQNGCVQADVGRDELEQRNENLEQLFFHVTEGGPV